MLCMGMPAFAQDDDVTTTRAVSVPKKKPAKVPTYPTMEVKGVCEDAVTKKPLAGIMVNALNDKRYTAMTEENGEFVIKVPTFVTALYVHAPQYLSQQVGLGSAGLRYSIEMLSDKFRPCTTRPRTSGSWLRPRYEHHVADH